jgi:MYXO-CTERM domain-containing protein
MRVGALGFRVLMVGAALCALLFSSRAHARSGGIGSALLGASGCNQCHSGGTAPAVTLSASSLALAPGDQITLTLTVTTPNAGAANTGAAGFNLRSSKAGTFALGGLSSANTQVGTTLNGVATTSGFSEATHTSPKAGEPATFTVLWRPNAGTTGSVIFTAWGNAVNLSGNPTGDLAASTTLGISICVPQTWYRDVDGDGFGALSSGTASACSAPTGFVTSNTDCQDSAPSVHPGAAEICNGIDENCAGGVDEGLPLTMYYRDADGDTFGVAVGAKVACSLAQAGPGYVANSADCNDTSVAVRPGAIEICNGIDDNCAAGSDEGGVCVGNGGGGAGGEGGEAGAAAGVAGSSSGGANTGGTNAGGNVSTGGVSSGGTLGVGTGGLGGGEDQGGAGGVGADAGAAGITGIGEGGSTTASGGSGNGAGSSGGPATGGVVASGGAAARGGSSSAGGASGGKVGHGGGAGGSPPAPGEGDEGCSCRAAGSPRQDQWLLFAAALGLTLVGRRRRS